MMNNRRDRVGDTGAVHQGLLRVPLQQEVQLHHNKENGSDSVLYVEYLKSDLLR